MWPPGVCYVRVSTHGHIALVSYMPLARFLRRGIVNRERLIGHEASYTRHPQPNRSCNRRQESIDMLVGSYLDRSDNFAAPDIKPCME